MTFVGATDSAAPCAMMLDLAEALNPLLDARKQRQDAGDLSDDEDEDVLDTTLQLVFFDGEEAFVSWTATDSIYGARHLASRWESTYSAPHEKRRLMGLQPTELDGIEHLILLDLLGAPQPLIRSFFLDTAWLFDALISVERRLGDSGAFNYSDNQEMAPGKWSSYFRSRQDAQMNYGHIGDDHIPFLEKGVSILHLIPEPFPRVWHTLKVRNRYHILSHEILTKAKDDASALDIPTMRRWNIILRVFLSEYLHLRPGDSPSPSIFHRSISEFVSI
ncbi:hypothetical protein C0993_009701 [Termitomyces sp. T159_Od127]|nr:hypothetical protein C0993_009701 [Termitomyces sp. T159_Od127]